MSEIENERFRSKVRSRNLGTVETWTYPANPQSSERERVLSKLELHRKHGRDQADQSDAKPAEEKPAEAKAETAPAAAEPKPKVDAKPAEEKRK